MNATIDHALIDHQSATRLSQDEQPRRESDAETSVDDNVEAAKPDAQEVAEEDTYLHGMRLVLVFIALAMSIFLIVLDQTVRRARW